MPEDPAVLDPPPPPPPVIGEAPTVRMPRPLGPKAPDVPEALAPETPFEKMAPVGAVERSNVPATKSRQPLVLIEPVPLIVRFVQ